MSSVREKRIENHFSINSKKRLRISIDSYRNFQFEVYPMRNHFLFRIDEKMFFPVFLKICIKKSKNWPKTKNREIG